MCLYVEKVDSRDNAVVTRYKTKTQILNILNQMFYRVFEFDVKERLSHPKKLEDKIYETLLCVKLSESLGVEMDSLQTSKRYVLSKRAFCIALC